MTLQQQELRGWRKISQFKQFFVVDTYFADYIIQGAFISK